MNVALCYICFNFCRQRKSNVISTLNEAAKNSKNGVAHENDFNKKVNANGGVNEKNNLLSSQLKINENDSKFIHKISWPIADWNSAPTEVLLCSNWWNWTDHQCMNRSETGFDYVLDLTAHSSDHKEEFLFKFIVDGSWQSLKKYPTKIDSNGIENNHLVVIDN